MSMHISQTGVDFIKQWEKLRLSPYDDGYGYKTIGYGHRIKEKESFPATILESTAEELLRKDVQIAVDAVNRLVKVPLTQPQFDALVSIFFNCGSADLANSTLLRELNQGKYVRAAHRFAQWHNADNQPSKGLLRRRIKEIELFLS